MKRTVRKIRKIVCCLLVGLLLSEQIVAAVHAEENGQFSAGNVSVSGNDVVPDNVSDAGNIANEELATAPYAAENRVGAVGDIFTEGNLQYRISGISAEGELEVVCIGIVSGSPGLELIIPGRLEHEGVPCIVWRIEEGAFAEQAGTLTNILRSVTIEQGIREIGNQAFYNCQELSKVILPKDGLEKIGEKAFCLCAKVESIDIPSSVQEIGEGAFSSCTGMSGSIQVPDGIEILKDNIFSGCFSSEIWLPDSLKQIKDDVFRTNRLLHINIPKDVTWIGSCAFLNSPYLEEIRIPDGVTYIGGSAFGNCAKLKSIVIPDKVTRLNYGTLADCIALESVTLPEGLTYIDYEAFRNCRSLQEVNIPGAVQYIAYRAFEGCTSLTELTVRDTIYFKGEAYPYYKDIFQQCGSFATLKIIVTGDVPLAIDPRLSNIFQDCPADRRLVFLNEDGTELTGDALAAARNAYRAVNDGETEDDLWYGWKIGDTPEAPSVTLYQITATASGGGHISPDGTVKVNEGTDQTFTITPQEGYEIQEVLVDGQSQGAVNSYTFTDVRENHTISVSFDRKEEPVSYFRITATAGGGGSISPAGTVNVAAGGRQFFTIIPDEGYRIEDVLVDGKSQGAIDNHSFTNVRENHTISVTFLKKEETGGSSGTEKPGENEDGTGGTEKPGENEGGTGGTEKPGGNEGGTGGTEKPGGNEGGTGGTEKPGGNAGGTGGTEKPGENAGGTSGTEKPGGNEGGTGGTEKPGENVGGNTETNQPEGNESDRAAEDNGNAAGTGSTGAAVNHGAGGPSEPKTGDVSRVEVYATAAMIAGLLYLLSYFVESKGMTEAEKKKIIASIISWANEGRKYRRYVAFAAIFFVLVYYHSIGRSTAAEKETRKIEMLTR